MSSKTTNQLLPTLQSIWTGDGRPGGDVHVRCVFVLLVVVDTIIITSTFSLISVGRWLDKVLWTPSRKYDQANNSVGKEYDAWEQVSKSVYHIIPVLFMLRSVLDVIS